VWDALSFDIDDTLVQRNIAMRELLSRELSCDLIDEAMALDDREANLRLFGWLADHGRFSSPGAARSWFRRELPNHVRPSPAVCSTLRQLAERYALVVVSNGGAAQRRKLDNAGVSEFFVRVYVSAEARTRKPAATMFRRAATDIGVPHARILHVGDDPIADVAGAQAAGFGTCWVGADRCYPHEAPRPTFQVRDITEVPQRLSC